MATPIHGVKVTRGRSPARCRAARGIANVDGLAWDTDGRPMLARISVALDDGTVAWIDFPRNVLPSLIEKLSDIEAT